MIFMIDCEKIRAILIPQAILLFSAESIFFYIDSADYLVEMSFNQSKRH